MADRKGGGGMLHPFDESNPELTTEKTTDPSIGRVLLSDSKGGGGFLLEPIEVENKNLKEIVFLKGHTEKLVHFIYGQAINGIWKIENIEMSKTEIQEDQKLLKALVDSSMTHSWTKLL